MTWLIFSRGFSGVCIEYSNEGGKASLQPKLQLVLGVANNLTLDEMTFPGDACNDLLQAAADGDRPIFF